MEKDVALHFIANRYDDVRGGYLSPILQIAHFNKYKGLVLFTAKNPLFEIAKKYNVIPELFKFNNVNSLMEKKKLVTNLITYPSFFVRMAKIVFEKNVKIIHVHNLESFLLMKPVSFIFNKAIVFHIRGDSNFEKKIWISSFKNADRIVVVSESLKQKLIDDIKNSKFSNLISKKIRYIPNGVTIPNNNGIKERNQSPQSLKLIIVGSIESRKGQYDFIKNVFPLIKNKHLVQLVIVGGVNSNEQFELINELIRDKSYNIIFTGRLDDLHDTYASASMLISYSEYEGMPRNVLDAMAYSLPVVVSDVIGNRDLVSNGNNGFKINRKNFEEFAKKIDMLILNNELRTQMGKYGRILIEENYDILKSSKEIENIYDELVGS